ncbi:hypothetical protein [Streptomyces spiramenti]|uniref:Uncharacterized protein n=1 Tax=Streptomyces spiramenti TaxID=2720606 RepID=A0ABX1AF42_9ACTN|nr:hypothetical protein [Streptomyces spiramenti]NJP65729.1 hypothetical protein [Streptomyces spiramenti]
MAAERAVDGYWAEVKVRSPDAGGEWYLAGAWFGAASAAVDWLHGEAERLAAVLESFESEQSVQSGYSSPVSAVFREWAADEAFRVVQCAALADGQPISANARGPDRVCGAGNVEVLYSLAARPILRPVLTPFGSSRVDRR